MELSTCPLIMTLVALRCYYVSRSAIWWLTKIFLNSVFDGRPSSDLQGREKCAETALGDCARLVRKLQGSVKPLYLHTLKSIVPELRWESKGEPEAPHSCHVVC